MVATKNKHLKSVAAIGENHSIFSRVNASKKDESSDCIISNDKSEGNTTSDYAEKGHKSKLPSHSNNSKVRKLNRDIHQEVEAII